MDHFSDSIQITAGFGKRRKDALGEAIKAQGGSRLILACGRATITLYNTDNTSPVQLGKAGLSHTGFFKDYVNVLYL